MLFRSNETYMPNSLLVLVCIIVLIVHLIGLSEVREPCELLDAEAGCRFLKLVEGTCW